MTPISAPRPGEHEVGAEVLRVHRDERRRRRPCAARRSPSARSPRRTRAAAWRRGGSRRPPPACVPGMKPGRVDEHDERQAEARCRCARSARPSRPRPASITPPRYRGWLAITPTGRPSMRASAVTMLRAQRGETSSRLAAVDQTARSRRARRRPGAARAGTAARRVAPAGRPASGARRRRRRSRCGRWSSRSRTSRRRRRRRRRRRAGRRRCARAPAGRRARPRRRPRPCTSRTTPGPVRNIARALGHHDEVGERRRVGAAAGRDAR